MSKADVKTMLLADLDAAARSTDPVTDTCRAVHQRLDDLAEAIEPSTTTVLDTWRCDHDLTVLVGWWAPGAAMGPHDHGLWLVAGVFAGTEDNHLFTRNAGTINHQETIPLRAGGVLTLGAGDIHSVTNSQGVSAGVIQVYGGNLFEQQRSFFDRPPDCSAPSPR